jgi:flagellin
MGLTISSSQTLSLLNIIGSISNNQNDLMSQLSTGKKINKGSDNPAGLIAVTSMNTELTAVNAAIDNGQRADSMLNVADGAMTQIGSLLTDIESLAAASTSESGLSAAELSANQAQIDQAISSIDRIIGTTSFNGKKLLDGSMGVRTTGVDATKVNDVKVYSRDSAATDTDISVALTAAAAKATKTGYAVTSATSATKIAVTGTLGTATIDIAVGDKLSAVAKKINDASAQTGVTASATAANTNLSLISTTYGSASSVSVQNLSGDATHFGELAKTTGTDAKVTVNGQTASVDGLNVNFNGGGVSLSFTLTKGYNDGTVTGAEAFKVTDGGATFQLGTDATTRSTIGLDALNSDMLGSSDVGYLSSLKSGGANSLTKDPTNAVTIIKKAVSQMAMAQGRVGGFQKFQIKTSVNALQATKQSLEDAKGSIENVDYAQATSEMNRQQVLMQAAMGLLGIANNQAQSVLKLL